MNRTEDTPDPALTARCGAQTVPKQPELALRPVCPGRGSQGSGACVGFDLVGKVKEAFPEEGTLVPRLQGEEGPSGEMGKTACGEALSGSEGNEFRAWMVVAEAGVEMWGEGGLEEPGGSEGFRMTPQASWWRVKAPVQSGPRSQVWGESWSSRPRLLGLSLLHLPGVSGFFLSCVFSTPFLPLQDAPLRGQEERRPGEGQGFLGPHTGLGQSRAGLPFRAVLAADPWTPQAGPEPLLSTLCLAGFGLMAPSPPESIVKEPLCLQHNF